MQSHASVGWRGVANRNAMKSAVMWRLFVMAGWPLKRTHIQLGLKQYAKWRSKKTVEIKRMRQAVAGVKAKKAA